MQTNPQLQLAFDFIQHTGKNVFLTGKAGTGKTTFLLNLKKKTHKRIAIVAPTGVAAINAGGVTINSFFQLPFTPFLPQQGSAHGPSSFVKKFRRDKIHLIKSLDVLVIDEISMVRADVLDHVDHVLRLYRNKHLPFGGLQLLMIGDLHQLAPIVKDDEWQLLKDYYENIYFFSSKALLQSAPVTIELKEIFRQSDEHFIAILNKVRENNLDAETLAELNTRFLPNFIPAEDQEYITLTTHNNTAQHINQQKLKSLTSKSHAFKAAIKGDFPEYAYPTDVEFQLKEQAQVMFVKNDPSPEKLFYNGKIGHITRISEDAIFVKCKDDKFEIKVVPVEWKNIRYSLNSDKSVKEDVTGSFTQMPLKLAWAITIHKSQGLTFDRAIIDAQASFAHGQVYVALSRCKTLEGIVLRSQISEESIKTNHTIKSYTDDIEKNIPNSSYLFREKINFQLQLLHELFDFAKIKRSMFYLQKGLQENNNTIAQQAITLLAEIIVDFEKDCMEVNNKFSTQLAALHTNECLPEENNALQERITKAASYFSEKLEAIYIKTKSIVIETDNTAIRKQLTEWLQNLCLLIFEKLTCLKKAESGFAAIDYIQTKANATIDFEKEYKSKNNEIAHTIYTQGSSLLTRLRNWRNDKAAEHDTDVYMIISRKAIDDIVLQIPRTLKQLAAINGIGKVKLKTFGEELLKIINDYCTENNIAVSVNGGIDMDEKAEATSSGRVNSKLLSLESYKQGKSIKEIAAERNFAVSTIEGHLAYYAGQGEINPYKLITQEKFDSIAQYIRKHETKSLTEIKDGMGSSFSYFEIRVVLQTLLKNTASQSTD